MLLRTLDCWKRICISLLPIQVYIMLLKSLHTEIHKEKPLYCWAGTSPIRILYTNLFLVWQFDEMLCIHIPPIVMDFTEKIRLERRARGQVAHPLAWRQGLFFLGCPDRWLSNLLLKFFTDRICLCASVQSVICAKAIKSAWMIWLCPCSISN